MHKILVACHIKYYYALCMVAYFCHHLSDNYVDLSDIYVDLSDLYVDCQIFMLTCHLFPP